MGWQTWVQLAAASMPHLASTFSSVKRALFTSRDGVGLCVGKMSQPLSGAQQGGRCRVGVWLHAALELSDQFANDPSIHVLF